MINEVRELIYLELGGINSIMYCNQSKEMMNGNLTDT